MSEIEHSSCNAESVRLREYVEKMFALHKEAVDKAEITMNRRLEGMNEFRHQLDKQQSTFVTHKDIEPLIKFNERIFGILAAVTFLNGIITALIVLLLRK